MRTHERFVDPTGIRDLGDTRIGVVPETKNAGPTPVDDAVCRHLVDCQDEVTHPRLAEAESGGVCGGDAADGCERVAVEPKHPCVRRWVGKRQIERRRAATRPR